MTRRYPLALALALSAAAFVATSPAGAQKNKPPSEVPGSFTMRTTPPYDPDATNADRVTGDEGGPYGADEAGTYVKLNSNREFRAGLYGLRYLQLDFLEEVVGPLCATCFREFERFVVPQPNTYPPEGPYRVVMQTNVVDVFNVETPNGLLGIGPGNASPARFSISFEDPNGRDFHWSVIFNPAEYPGSSLAVVRRTAACEWVIEANETGVDAAGSPTGARAGLRAWAVLKGKNNSTNEGVFSMPFSLIFSVDNCGA